MCTDATTCSFRLPLSWFQLHLMCLASESGTVLEPISGILTFSELRTICLKEELVSSGNEFKAMVTVFHSLEVFSYTGAWQLKLKRRKNGLFLLFFHPGRIPLNQPSTRPPLSLFPSAFAFCKNRQMILPSITFQRAFSHTLLCN